MKSEQPRLKLTDRFLATSILLLGAALALAILYLPEMALQLAPVYRF